ncbi:Retrotransposon-derived protein PEG10 AltName: Full=Embryonal carcinoma differentiation regulated protein [Rhizoctonia solani AG-1 IB]|uniref:Rhizoctonia solani AG1-IB WGS project CAOJ00000000 data, isolate 7/3/14, contig 16221 n=1 Tax=Thanatephorus cucumeris (strain AG1-IB / isolate 7/3/14) TaxID=1108050 RepID=M5C1G5_THACB|nr:Retrotransposon-derived protein PEG10 AltName: Full=Embryonal carcinoma differentiation regulated protein [Rhizoctonia solani AG-1 IB]
MSQPSQPSLQDIYDEIRRLRDVVDILRNVQANHDDKLNHITEVVEELSQAAPTAATVHTPKGTATADSHETPRAPKPLGVAFAEDIRMGKRKTNIKREDDNDPWHSVSDSGDELPDEPTSSTSAKRSPKTRRSATRATSTRAQSLAPGEGQKTAKMEVPKPYDGTKRGKAAEQWFTRMGLYIVMNKDRFDNEDQALIWILYNMEGKAADWATPIIDDITSDKPGAPKDVKELMARFAAAFSDPDAKRAASRKIVALQQTTSTADYVTEFRNISADLDWNDSALQDQFLRSVHWKVKEQIALRDSNPTSIEELFNVAIRINNIRRENNENRPKRPQPSGPQATTTTTVSTTSTARRVEIEKSPNYVAPEERDRCRAEGLCVKCGDKGHIFRNCPNGWKTKAKIETAKTGEDQPEKE